MNYLQTAPLFQLYGEQAGWPLAEMLHCETIASRSSLHNWHIRPHRHAGLYQILYLHQGRAIVSLEQRRPAIRAPAVVEVPQAYVHGFEFDADCAGYVITITNALLAHLTQRLGPSGAAPHHPMLHRLTAGAHSDSLHEACAQLNAQYAARLPFREAQIEAWLTLLYARLRHHPAHDAPTRQPDRGMQHYARFGELLERAHSRQHAVAWYADTLGLSTTHLNLITRTHAEKTPLQLIHERLALEASRSLIYTSMTISEISDALGFSEPAHFTRFFRKAAGQSPRDFRQRMQSAVSGLEKP
ncbi:MAG: helix-turn-helix domain-containing protein [Castellaniella sp.]|uniref:helix-turn-helix domain-containing protein n=1 Tax=Castellaniella sp. TaxID=1955812 RepID=UPI003C731EE9